MADRICDLGSLQTAEDASPSEDTVAEEEVCDAPQSLPRTPLEENRQWL